MKVCLACLASYEEHDEHKCLVEKRLSAPRSAQPKVSTGELSLDPLLPEPAKTLEPPAVEPGLSAGLKAKDMPALSRTASRGAGGAPNVVPEHHLNAAEIEDENLDADAKFHVEKREDPMSGQCIAGRYAIIAPIGRGGMGVVYKAEHLNIDRLVAIKVLHPHLVQEAAALQRFRQEAFAVSKVDHIHSVRIYDFGIADQGQPYLVMDFIDGVSLRQSLKQNGLLSLSRAADIVEQVVDALGCAHGAGVIHRDLKPENIMLGHKEDRQDWVSVVDFGISKLTVTQRRPDEASQSDTRGSPPYMSPEQCTAGAEIDQRSDIYSLAVLVYESLSGRLPYQARNSFEMMDAHVSGSPLPLSSAHAGLAACEAITAVLEKALEKNPDKRQQTAELFGEEFRDAVRGDTIRLNSLKNRRGLLDGSNSQSMEVVGAANLDGQSNLYDDALCRSGQSVALVPSAKSTDAKSRLAQYAASRPRPKPKSFFGKILDVITGKAGRGLNEQRNYMFVNCPHCGDAVEPDIAFCLACGRTLATTQDYWKIRAAQGVFALPRSKDTSSNGLPVLQRSQKSRAVMADTNPQLTNALWRLAGLLLALAIFWAIGGWQFVRSLTSGSPH